MLTGLGIAATFIVGLLFTMLIPSFNENWSQNTAKDAGHFHAVYAVADLDKYEQDLKAAKPGEFVMPPKQYAGNINTSSEQLAGYTIQQQRGRRIYQREGCMYCHSQQIRPLAGEIERYRIGSSIPPIADEREYIWDQPHFLGTRRIGPDLSREGGKYSDDWHYSHFYYPRQMVPGSIMPAFTWLFKFTPDDVQKVNPIPTDDARDLVSYVQTLGFYRQVPDPTLNSGKGGWRSWLKPQDQQVSQSTGEGQVTRINPEVNGGKGGQVRGGDQISPTNRVVPGGAQ